MKATPHINSGKDGFTLVEILITTAMIAVLAGLTFTGYQTLKQRAQLTTEMGAGRALIQAYVGYAADNSGRLMPGYQKEDGLTNDRGEPLHFPVNARYPWRLAPYLPSIAGTLLIHGNENALDSPNRDYLVSVLPSFGINAVFVGGHYGSGSVLRPDPRIVQTLGKFYVSNLAEANNPGRLLVFCSARNGESGPGSGNFEVLPPKVLNPLWSSSPFKAEAAPSAHGMVDFRWSGRAVAVFLGGNAEVLDEDELRDMRLWSNLANIADDPEHVLQRQ